MGRGGRARSGGLKTTPGVRIGVVGRMSPLEVTGHRMKTGLRRGRMLFVTRKSRSGGGGAARFVLLNRGVRVNGLICHSPFPQGACSKRTSLAFAQEKLRIRTSPAQFLKPISLNFIIRKEA